MIMLGGHFPETENKRIGQTSSLKTGRGWLRNLRSSCLGESLELYLTEKQNNYLQLKVVTYGRRSHRRSGHYERVDFSSFIGKQR